MMIFISKIIPPPFWFLFCQDVGNDKLILGHFYFEDKKTKQDPVPFSSFYNFWLLTKYIRVRIKILPRISMKLKDKFQKGYWVAVTFFSHYK